MDEFDLTNLNWVSGAEAPMHASLSPPSSSNSKNHLMYRKQPNTIFDKFGNKKPLCSYTCLIALALKAATVTETGACLPVQEIYNCIEELFPFFKNVTDGWKNCVRHNLSLNHHFRKMLRDEGWEGKKGYFWEIIPESAETLEKEMEKFLKTEKRTLDDMRATLLYKWAKPSSNQRQTIAKKTPKTVVIQRTTKPRKEPEPEQEEDIPMDPSDLAIYSPQIQKQLKKCRTPIKPRTEETERVFNTNNTPSDFVGIQTPQSDDIGAAKELFGCGSTAETNSPCPMYMSTNHGEIIPFSTPPMYGMCGLPAVGYGYGTPNTSPIMSISPASSGYTTPFISPSFMPFMPVNMLTPCMMDYSGRTWPKVTPPCQNCGHYNSPLKPGSMSASGSGESPIGKPVGKRKYTKRKNSKTTTTPRKKMKTPKCTRKSQFQQETKKQPLHSKKTKPSTREIEQPPMREIEQQDEDSYIDVESDDNESLELFSPAANVSSSIMSDKEGHNFRRLGEQIEEAEGLVCDRTEMSLHSRNEQAPTGSSSQAVHSRPFKALPVLECISLAEGSRTHCSDSADEEGIPALHSLLDLGDASIVGIQNAMKMS